MKILERHYDNIFYFFLVAFPVSFIWMKFSNLLVVAFLLFNFLFFKKLNFTWSRIKKLLVLAIPLILNIFFMWNETNILIGLKTTEKYLLFLIFPLTIVCNDTEVNFKNLLEAYTKLMLITLIALFIWYLVVYPENIKKYIEGIHLWEMGYHFTKSFGVHAPSLNLHIAFLTVSSYYLFLNVKKGKKYLFIRFIFSLFFLLYVNTRLAIVSAIFGCVFINIFPLFDGKQIFKGLFIKKLISLLLIVLFSISFFFYFFPYNIEKFTKKSFSNMDMIGKLDQFEHPESEVYGALVTRVSIWKSSIDLAQDKILYGYGASEAKNTLFDYYKRTNQKFLYKYKFPVHNQYIDYLLKYGILGPILILYLIGYIGYIGYIIREELIIFFALHFFISNLTDDFLILYSGISFSAFWFSIFVKLSINNSEANE